MKKLINKTIEENKNIQKDKELLINDLKNLINQEQINYSKSLLEKDKKTELLEKELKIIKIK